MKKSYFLPIVIIFCIYLIQGTSFAASYESRDEAMNRAFSQTSHPGTASNTVTELSQTTADSNPETKFSLHNNTGYDPAGATTNTRGKFYISGGFDGNHFYYKELLDKHGGAANELDKDYGYLKGFYAAAGYRSNCYIEKLINGKPFIEGYIHHYTNLITYDGGSSLGPLKFNDENAKITRLGVKVGVYNEFSPKGEISFCFDMGRRAWDRGQNRIIQGVIDYAEKYTWTYFGVGAGVNYKLTPKFTAGIEAEGMAAPSAWARMRSDYDDYTYELGTVYGAELKLPLKYYLSKYISIDATPYLEYWDIEKSNEHWISSTEYMYEPHSQTTILGILAGISLIY